MTETPHVKYWAISVLSSRTVWVNTAALLVAVFSLTEVITIIPLRFMPMYSAVVATLNLYLRTVTVRPVAFIAPGTTVPVQIAKIDPPTKAVTD